MLLIFIYVYIIVCENICGYSNDGQCDDGGPNSMSSYCDYGTDCNDCGCRENQTTPTDTPSPT